MRDVLLIGAGMHRYGVFPDKSFVELGLVATTNALEDAGMEWKDIQAAFCGHIGGGMSAGHRVFESLGASGLEITNVENASASGSAAFRQAYLAVGSGEYDVALALGADKRLDFAALAAMWRAAEGESEYAAAMARAAEVTQVRAREADTPEPGQSAVHVFAAVAKQYMGRYGLTRDQLAKVSVKSHYNASMNPYAHFHRPMTLEEVKAARMVADPLTVPQCCPLSEGGAAAIVCAPEVSARFTTKPCPTIAASVCTSRRSEEEPGLLTRTTAEAATIAHQRAGIGVDDLDIVELHDAFTIEEILCYEALGLCPAGEGGRLIDEGTTEITGRLPVNTSGGLISVGHPNGPTGIGQIAEVLWQMRGEAGGRQVKDPKVGLVHMVGAGGVCIIHIFIK